MKKLSRKLNHGPFQPRRYASSVTADVVVCGAGVAGLSAASYLTNHAGLRVIVVDERPPFSFTSSMSSEAYRNFWPSLEMTQFMNRSIDLMEERAEKTGNQFAMNRRGYAFCSAKKHAVKDHEERAQTSSEYGAGPVTKGKGDFLCNSLRGTELSAMKPINGIHLLQSAAEIQEKFPFLTSETQALLYARRCGWVNAQQLGTVLLDEVKAGGAKLLPGTLMNVDCCPLSGRVQSVSVKGSDRFPVQISTSCFVNASGPFTSAVNRLVPGSDELPLKNEIHAKAVFHDFLGIVPEDCPMMIWEDEVLLDWSEEEQEMLNEMGGFAASLTKPLPGGAHFRPYGNGYLVMLWEFVHKKQLVADPPPTVLQFYDLYAEVVVRGLSAMVPRMKEYLGRIPRKTLVDGGYYCQAPDNRPLVGRTSIPGYYLCTGLSGYGIMGCSAAGELLGKVVESSSSSALESIAPYARALAPDRFDDAKYMEELRGALKSSKNLGQI